MFCVTTPHTSLISESYSSDDLNIFFLVFNVLPWQALATAACTGVSSCSEAELGAQKYLVDHRRPLHQVLIWGSYWTHGRCVLQKLSAVNCPVCVLPCACTAFCSAQTLHHFLAPWVFVILGVILGLWKACARHGRCLIVHDAYYHAPGQKKEQKKKKKRLHLGEACIKEDESHAPG
jgi:hypothetical protein